MPILSDVRTKHPFEFLKLIAIAIALAAAVAQFARFLYIALSRITFPFSLEWMEGGSFVQVSRLLEGQPLYVRPSFDFIPQIYPPVYFYLSALASKLIGNSFVPLRLVSILATIGILFLIYELVYKQYGSRLGGVLASGFFCATYQLSGHWFDIARVDSLALAFLLLAAYFLLKDRPTASMLGGIFLALSCFTKQTMLIVAGVFLIYCLLPLRKHNLLFIGTALLAFVAGTAALDWASDGWYSYYIFHLPGRHNLLPNVVTLVVSTKNILFDEIVNPALTATLIGLAYLLLFSGEKGFSGPDSRQNEAIPDPAWSRRALWALIFLVGGWAAGSLWYLANLPSDAEGGVIGRYSLARLALMAGPVLAGILVFALANKMRRNPAWTDQVARRSFGNIHTIPRIVIAVTSIAIASVVVLASIQPGIYANLSTTFLQRLSPYVLGPSILVVVALALWRILWTGHHLETWFYLLLFSGLVAASWLGRLNPGGYNNVFMTAYAGIAILFGSGVGWLLQKSPAGAPVNSTILTTLVLFLVSAQLIVLFSPPAAQIPTQADKAAGQALVSQIRACPGNVYIPFHTYLAELAGKDGYAGVVEMGELRGSFGGKRDPLWEQVLNQMQRSLDAHTFAAIIQDNQLFRYALSSSYVETGRVFEKELVFWPMTGRKIRPETIYAPANGGGCLLTVD
jgi:hypothetical protein